MRFAQLFGLVNLALARPLFELLAREPAFFIAHHLRFLDVVLLAIVVCFGLPLILLAVEHLVPKRWATPLHRLLIGSLVAVLFQQAAARLVPEVLAIAIAVVLALLSIAALRWHPTEMVLTFLGPLALAIPLLLVSSETTVSLAAKAAPTFSLPISRPAPVILIVFDELPLLSLMTRDGAINSDRFPASIKHGPTSAGMTTNTDPRAPTCGL